MEALKIIPQAFFDLIARVAPGFATLILFAWREPETWRRIVDLLGVVNGSQSTELPWWLLFGAAYVTGHVISPATKLVQRITERFPRTKDGRKHDWLLRWFGLDSKETVKKSKPDSKKYDWLRTNSPDVGGISAKLRAEFTFYNALSAIFALFGLMSITCHRQFDASAILLFAAILMAARGRETEDTMRKCVENFYDAATGDIQRATDHDRK